MSMTVLNNAGAALTLGELNKNITKVGKALSKVASGMKIVGAEDGAAQFAISELMRVKIRAMNQANQNVQNGGALLRTAGEAIQQQIEMVRTVKEKVIDAANDTNTDEDRRIIQKEINQLYDQIEQTAYYTEYNTEKVLLGDTYKKKLVRYFTLPKAELSGKTDLKIIPDIYDTLDGVVGAFDIFSSVGTETSKFSTLLKSKDDKAANGFTEGVTGYFIKDGDITPAESGKGAILDIDFSVYADVDDLNGAGIKITGVDKDGNEKDQYFVFTKTPNKNYMNLDGDIIPNSNKISLSGITSVAAAVKKFASTLNNDFKSKLYLKNAAAGGTTLTLQSSIEKELSNQIKAVGFETLSGYAPAVATIERDGRKAGMSGTLSGGSYPFGSPYPDPDATSSPGSRAAWGPKDISKLKVPCGITITTDGKKYTVEFIKEDNDHILEEPNFKLKIDEDFDHTFDNGITMTIKNGKLSFKAPQVGAYYNGKLNITDGYKYRVPIGSTIFPVEGTDGRIAESEGSGGKDGEDAVGVTSHYIMDLTHLNTTDGEKLEKFISDIKGKALHCYNRGYYEFYDSTESRMVYPTPKVSYTVDPIDLNGPKIDGSVAIDVNEIRRDVTDDGMTIAESFAKHMAEAYGENDTVFLDASDSDLGGYTGVERLRFNADESTGSVYFRALKGDDISRYEIDFNKWLSNRKSNSTEENFSDDLSYKGFRMYCATCPNQWYNIIFYNESDDIKNKPISGTGGEDFHTILVDVTGVTGVSQLVQAIDEQAKPVLNDIGHTLYLDGNTETGIVTVYDYRKYSTDDSRVFRNRQTYGAKIADCIIDDVVQVSHKLYVKDFIIQDTDKADMNIRVSIPDMRLNSIFGVMPDRNKNTIRDYSLTSKSDIESLLGKYPVPGILDEGINYLLDASTTVGAQAARLEYTQNNRDVQVENIQAAESTTRDADIAKEMAEYTKYNVLQQAAQSMLAQANQNAVSVLSLLQ